MTHYMNTERHEMTHSTRIHKTIRMQERSQRRKFQTPAKKNLKQELSNELPTHPLSCSLKMTLLAPKTSRSESSVTTPATSSRMQRYAICASASYGATMNSSPSDQQLTRLFTKAIYNSGLRVCANACPGTPRARVFWSSGGSMKIKHKPILRLRQACISF